MSSLGLGRAGTQTDASAAATQTAGSGNNALAATGSAAADASTGLQPHSGAYSSSSSGGSLHPSPSSEGEAEKAPVVAVVAPAAHDKKQRACEACRSLKVRCDMDPAAPPETPCRRCTKAGRACVVTQPTRRRQKKTDSRVAELEKKIDALTASLQMSRRPAEEAPQLQSLRPLPPPLPMPRQPPPPPPARQPPALQPPPPPEPTSSPPTAVPPMVMAGQKRKFADMWEPTAAAAGTSAGSSTGSRQRSRSATEGESPMVWEWGQAGQAGQPGQPGQPGQSQPRQGSGTAAGGPATSGDHLGYNNISPAEGPATGFGDIIDRGLLTMETAVELFQRYTEHMARHMPAVVFPAGTTAGEVRKSKPTLFLALMAAATTEMPNVQRPLVKELMQTLAEKIIVMGEKSLELVQTLQISVIWYWPPEHFEELKFYQLVHMAAVMAIDIGLGKRRSGVSSGVGSIPGGPGILGRRDSATGGAATSATGNNRRDHPFKKHPLPDPCTLECRRAWLSCYFMTSNASMALHRPNLVRWTSFMSDCVRVLSSSPDAAPSDAYLCHLVWTHRMAEEVGTQFSMEDPSAAISLNDTRTQYALRAFERDLARYRALVPRSLMQPSLRLSFEVLNLYMHEIALQTEGSELPEAPGCPGHLGDGPGPITGPVTGDAAQSPTVPAADDVLIAGATLTPAHINALTSCLQAIDGIFDTFLGMDIAALRCIPVFNFVRVAYATVVLIKLYFAAAAPNSELGRVIDKDNMKVEQHLNALLDKFRATVADNRSRPAGKFLIVLVMIRTWFFKQRQQQQQQQQQHHVDKEKAEKAETASNKTPASAPAPPPYLASPSFLLNSRPSCITPSATLPAEPAYALQPPLDVPAFPTVNTPLQLLSEIAANDSAVQERQAQSRPQPQPQPQAQQKSQPQQPPQPPQQQSQHPQQQPLNMSWFSQPQQPVSSYAGPTESLITSDFMGYPNIGENFEYAMDLTFAGLSDAGNESLFGLADMSQYWGGDSLFNSTANGFQF